MDGLLLDTERLAMAAFESAIVAHGFPFVREAYLRCVGTRDEGTRQILIDHYGPGLPYDAIVAMWSERYHGHVMHHPVDRRPGAEEILALATDAQLPMALATSTKHAVAVRKLELAGIERFFRVVIGGDLVRAGKPDPEPYRRAAAGLGLSPDACWAFEDSTNGVRSARGAGVHVIQIPDLVAPEAGLADVVLPSLNEAAALLAAALGR